MGQGTSCYECLVTNKPIVSMERQRLSKGGNYNRNNHSTRNIRGNLQCSNLLELSSVMLSDGVSVRSGTSGNRNKIVMKSIIEEEEKKALYKDSPLVLNTNS